MKKQHVMLGSPMPPAPTTRSLDFCTFSNSSVPCEIESIDDRNRRAPSKKFVGLEIDRP